MQLHTLAKLKTQEMKRLGRGHGSGRGKTSGRGTKGRKAHGDVPATFEGGALPLIKRLPMLRGKGKNPATQRKMIAVNIEMLNALSPKSDVTVELLVKEGIVDKKALRFGVKILGKGEISVPLEVKVPVSKTAQAKIEQAKGSVTIE